MFTFRYNFKQATSFSHSIKLYINKFDKNLSSQKIKFLALSECIGLSCPLCCTYTTRVRNAPVTISYYSFQSSLRVPKKPPIVIMHGLLGSKNNWKSIGKVLNQKTGRAVFTVDARNHGESPHTIDFNYYALSNDVQNFLEEQVIDQACLIGHSMGGRAMMATAIKNPELVEKLFVLDISPFGVSDGVTIVPKFIDMMMKLQIPPELELPQARKYVDELLKEITSDNGIRLFLVSNLEKKEEKFSWRVNLDSVARNFNPNITTFPPASEGRRFKGPTYFIGGGLSDYIKRDDHNHIRTIFPKAEFHYLDGAGHWLHAEKPQEFINLITPLINQ